MKMKYCFIVLCLIFVVVGCRGQLSENPPIHLNQNMDNQQKYLSYGKNDFFKDKRNMRPIPRGTIPWSEKLQKKSYQTGKSKKRFLKKNPEQLTEKFVRYGQERYDIYCAVCHGYTGVGNGIVTRKGFIPPPSYLDKRILKLSDGEIFSIITNGVRNMPSYAVQIPIKDRWAIVSYVRALQKAETVLTKK